MASRWPQAAKKATAEVYGWTGAGVLHIETAHIFAVLFIRLAFVAADGHDKTFDDVVVGHVLLNACVDPVVPVLRRCLANQCDVVQLVITVAGKVAQFGRPPRGVTGTFEQFVDLLSSLVL